MVERWLRFLMLAYAFWALPVWGGEIRGVVTDAGDGAPLPGVNLRLTGTQLGGVSNAEGRYVIAGVPTGTYQMKASMVGYRPHVLAHLVVQEDGVVVRNLVLQTSVLSLEEIVVTPGRFSVLKHDPTVPQTLSRDEIEEMPHLGEDIYRAVARLPGVSGNDFSSRFSVRGGDHDQVLVQLDGLELYEPFHLKDFAGGAFSIVDVEVIGGIDMTMGGFSADYGDRQSAVVEMKSRTSQVGRRTSLGIGILNTRLLSEGATEQVGWLFSARRGYIDLALKLTGEEEDLSPDYYDLFGKLTFGGDRHRFGLHVLWASDHFHYVDEDDDPFDSAYGNGYAWMTWETTLGSGAHLRSLPYVGRTTTTRDGLTFSSTREPADIVDDNRYTNLYGYKTDLKAKVGDNHFLRFGFDVKRLSAEYDYFHRRRFGSDTTQVFLTPSGTEAGIYLADKWRILDGLTADFGVRYDRHSYTGEGHTSPRAAVALSLGEKTVVRVAWGQYFQAQWIGDLALQYRDTEFRSAERATHYVVGIERNLGPGFQMRVEGYYKALKDNRDWWDNLDDVADFLPELSSRRLHVFPRKGVTRGIEMYLKRDTGGRVNWWVAYAYTKGTEIHDEALSHPSLQGQTRPQKMDQRHTFSIDAIYRSSARWGMSAAWQVRSGWPYTPLHGATNSRGRTYYTLRHADFNTGRYSAFHRLDVKIHRRFTFKRWQLSVSAEVQNLYNRHNVRSFWYWTNGGRTHERTAEQWLPRLPGFTVSAAF